MAAELANVTLLMHAIYSAYRALLVLRLWLLQSNNVASSQLLSSQCFFLLPTTFTFAGFLPAAAFGRATDAAAAAAGSSSSDPDELISSDCCR